MSYRKIQAKDIDIIKKLSLEKKSYTIISKELNISRHNVFKVINGIDKYDRGNSLRVDHVSQSLFDALTNIAENTDVKLPLIIKKQLRIFVENTPNHLKEKKIK